MMSVYEVSPQDWAVGPPGPSVSTPGAAPAFIFVVFAFLSLLLEITGTLDWTLDNNV